MQFDNRRTNAGWTRRSFLQASASAAAGALSLRYAQAAPDAFAPNWASLVEGYRTPDWFRDAKFGIWAHWSAQCVPEAGDWYARNMYIQGHPQYEHHVRDVRPSDQVRLHGDREPLEGRELGSRSADGSVREGRRELLRRAGQPSRQLRRLRLQAPRVELHARRARSATSSAPGRKWRERAACASV